MCTYFASAFSSSGYLTAYCYPRSSALHLADCAINITLIPTVKKQGGNFHVGINQMDRHASIWDAEKGEDAGQMGSS
ncbi:hypothetical protein VTN00DRAFT_5658 [Thermoascus crustaceus]|uniref:uncharacterized protein n=1 Tax=Thermoascus crustaceus TaxID=5088 RepID=UPI003742DAC2